MFNFREVIMIAGMGPGQFHNEKPKREGGISYLGVLGIVGAAVSILIIVGMVSDVRTSPSASNSGGSSTSGSSSSGGSSSSNSSDPIEQARVVLGGTYTYAQIRSVTDSALSSTGTAVTDSNRSRAWSAVLAAVRGLTEKGYSVAPMDVMRCVPNLGAVSGMDFSETAALCATDLAVNP